MPRTLWYSAFVVVCVACTGAPTAPPETPRTFEPAASDPATAAMAAPADPIDIDVAFAAAPSSRPSPLSVEVLGTRTGQALHVQVIGVARDYQVGSPFEDPARWQVTALASGVRLDRLVAGSTRISRLETRARRWDVTVEFDTAFGIPAGSAEAEIVVTPPGSIPSRFTIGLATARR